MEDFYVINTVDLQWLMNHEVYKKGLIEIRLNNKKKGMYVSGYPHVVTILVGKYYGTALKELDQSKLEQLLLKVLEVQ